MSRNEYEQDSPRDERRHISHPNAEAGVLASLIAYPDVSRAALRDVPLRVESFTTVAHQAIWRGLCALWEAGTEIDEISLCDALTAQGTLENAGGPSGIGVLLSRIESSGNVRIWAEIVYRLTLQRNLALTAARLSELAHGAYGSIGDFSDAVSPVREELLALSHTAIERESLLETIREARKRAVDWSAGKTDVIPASRLLTWGLPSLDSNFTKICKDLGDSLILIMGRSSHGKSTYARHLVMANIEAGRRALVFNLETTKATFVERYCGTKSRFDVGLLRRSGGLATVRSDYENTFRGQPAKLDSEWAALMAQHANYLAWLDWLAPLADTRLHCYEQFRTLDAICAETRDQARVAPIDLVCVDYLQLIGKEHRGTQRGDEILKDIVSGLKDLSAQVNCPILLISSITDDGNDQVTPSFETARGSRDIAYAADRAIIVFRPAKSTTGDDQEVLRTKLATHPLQIRIKQSKARDVPIWEQTVLFTGRYALFVDIPDAEHRGRPKGVRNGEGKMRQGEIPGTEQGAADFRD